MFFFCYVGFLLLREVYCPLTYFWVSVWEVMERDPVVEAFGRDSLEYNTGGGVVGISDECSCMCVHVAFVCIWAWCKVEFERRNDDVRRS